MRFLAAIPLLVAASCASAFLSTWTDDFGQTTYTLSAPDTVLVGESFDLTATVTDSDYPDDWVASSWAVTDNGSNVDGGFSLWTSGGVWQTVWTLNYAAEGAHLFEFTARDQGQGGGGHGWETFAIGGTTTVVPEPGLAALLVPLVVLARRRR